MFISRIKQIMDFIQRYTLLLPVKCCRNRLMGDVFYKAERLFERARIPKECNGHGLYWELSMKNVDRNKKTAVFLIPVSRVLWSIKDWPSDCG